MATLPIEEAQAGSLSNTRFIRDFAKLGVVPKGRHVEQGKKPPLISPPAPILLQIPSLFPAGWYCRVYRHQTLPQFTCLLVILRPPPLIDLFQIRPPGPLAALPPAQPSKHSHQFAFRD